MVTLLWLFSVRYPKLNLFFKTTQNGFMPDCNRLVSLLTVKFTFITVAYMKIMFIHKSSMSIFSILTQVKFIFQDNPKWLYARL